MSKPFFHLQARHGVDLEGHRMPEPASWNATWLVHTLWWSNSQISAELAMSNSRWWSSTCHSQHMASSAKDGEVSTWFFLITTDLLNSFVNISIIQYSNDTYSCVVMFIPKTSNRPREGNQALQESCQLSTKNISQSNSKASGSNWAPALIQLGRSYSFI